MAAWAPVALVILSFGTERDFAQRGPGPLSHLSCLSRLLALPSEGNAGALGSCWVGLALRRRPLLGYGPQSSHRCCPGLAVGLDPQGYGNPDFCWLSLQDTLIWSFAGPIGTVIIVSAGLKEPSILRDVGSQAPLHASTGRSVRGWLGPRLL